MSLPNWFTAGKISIQCKCRMIYKIGQSYQDPQRSLRCVGKCLNFLCVAFHLVLFLNIFNAE